MAEVLFNLIQSTNPCPDCEDASGEDSMTLRQWEGSSFGVPGSSGRVCEGNCHCLLIPDGTELPSLGTDLLRGDKGTDIPKITSEFPLEVQFNELVLQWRNQIGDLPGRFARMSLPDIIAEMKRTLK